MRVACVLRSGGDFRTEHVARLVGQVREHLPGAEIVCLSDVDVPCERIPLRAAWPGWWSKMELMAPWVLGDLLYLDLDSAVVGSLADMAAVGRLTLMRDAYRPEGLQSAVMYLPEADRAEAWEQWVAAPSQWMRQYAAGGDQAFLERLWLDRAARWQDVLPGQVCSYKVNVRKAQRRDREFGNGTVPEGTRVIAFHGKPRPWEVGW